LDTKEKGMKSHSMVNGYKDRRDMNLVNMIFNIEANNSNDYKKPLDVYDIYENMQELNLPVEFKKSLKNSKDCVKVPPLTSTKLSHLKKNDPNSFLALPVLGKGHLWSILIRKTEEGFSGMMINKGLRFWHDPVEEFLFQEENKNKLVGALKYCGAFKMHNVEDVYRQFIQNSDKKFNMAIHASPQKVGNCFTKNIQGAIKFAYATRNWDTNKIKALRTDQEYTSFGTPNQDKVTLKWGIMETEKMQKLFVKNVVANNPNIEKSAIQSEGIYQSNKAFRKGCKDSQDPVKFFLETFDLKMEAGHFQKGERLKSLLKNITPYTYEGKRKEIDKIVLATEDHAYIENYKKLGKYTALTKNNMGNLYFHFFIEAKHDIGKSLEKIFGKDGSYQNLSDESKNKILLEKLEPQILILHHGKIKNFLKTLYKKENVEMEYGNLYEGSKKRFLESTNKMPSPEDKKEFEKHFPIILGQVNHRLSEYYTTLKEAYIEKEKEPNPMLKTSMKRLEMDKQEMLEEFMLLIHSKVDREIEDIVGLLDEKLNDLDHKMDILETKIPDSKDERIKEFQNLRGRMFREFAELGSEMNSNYALLETATIKNLRKENPKETDYEYRLGKKVLDFDYQCEDLNRKYSNQIDTLSSSIKIMMEKIFDKKTPTKIMKPQKLSYKDAREI
jgi:hypothetical protein